MNKGLIINLIICSISFYINFKVGLFFLLNFVCGFIYLYFFSSDNLRFSFSEIKESEIYYINKRGRYSKLYNEFYTYKKVKNKFNLNDYVIPFGIFYDNPKTRKPKENFNSIIGFLIYNKNFNNIDNKEFFKYIEDNGYKKGKVPTSKIIVGSYDTFFNIYRIFPIFKFYISVLNKKFFKALREDKKIDKKVQKAINNYKAGSGVLEIYEKNKVWAVIPLENEKEFNLLKKS